MDRIDEKHALWLRWNHWLNFPILSLMVWSGLRIYWANDVYRPFFPAGFNTFFGLDHRLADGMAVHFSVAWLLVINALAYGIYLIVSSHWRELRPTAQDGRNFIPTILDDFGIRDSKIPRQKFNPVQKTAYSVMIFLGLLEILTGFAIYKPVQLAWLAFVFGGYGGARLVHFIVTMVFILFFFMHITQVMRAGWNNFRSMVTGFEVRDEK
jgi:thiosulfate reductase cytochrome b subunit